MQVNKMMTSMDFLTMKKNNWQKYSSFFCIVLLFLIIDQVTKWLATMFILQDEIVIIPYFLSLSCVNNTGAAWSIFQNNSTLLGILGILVLFLIFVSRNHLNLAIMRNQIAYGMICSGITGNIIDRLLFGSVIDFIDLQIGHYHWPIFNIADSVICIGVFLCFLFTFYPKTK